MKNKLQKIIILGSGLFLIFNFVYNQKKEASAYAASTEEPLAVCHITTINYAQCTSRAVCGSEEIDISLVQAPGEMPLCCPEQAIDNELEIQIGRLTDQTEALAKPVLIKTEEILESLGGAESINVDQYCKVENCRAQCQKRPEQQACIEEGLDCATELGEQYTPYNNCVPECPEESPQCCHWPAFCELDEDIECVGRACSPALTEILNDIVKRSEDTNKKIKELKEIINDKPKEIKEKLTQSRKKLFKCIQAPTAEEIIKTPEQAIESEEEILLREYTVLMNCADVIRDGIPIYSVLDQKLQAYCYGNQYCQASGMPEPCAEDYYCCH